MQVSERRSFPNAVAEPEKPMKHAVQRSFPTEAFVHHVQQPYYRKH